MRKYGFLFLLTALPVLTQEPAQQQQPIKAVVRKNLAPVSSEVLRVKLPRPVERKLKNGLQVLVFENHRVPSVTFELVLSASTLSDPAELPGVAEATSEMLKQGTKNRSAKQIAEELSELGTYLGVFCGWGARTTNMNGAVLTDNLDPWLDIFADVLVRASFPEDELAKWKKRKLASLQMARSQPQMLGNERFHRVLYPNDARGTVSVTAASLAKITRDDIAAFHKKHYVPGSAVLAVSGDVTPNDLVARLDKVLAGWETGAAQDPGLQPVPPLAEKKVYLVNRPGSVQTMLMMGNHGVVNPAHPDYPAVMVMNRILGGGPTSRLFMRIREELGFTYGVGSGFAAQRYKDQFTASSSVRTSVTGAALDEFLSAFRKMREEAVPADDLVNAKRAIVASFALSIESPRNAIGQTLSIHEFGLPADFWDRYPEKVMAVTAEEVQRVARKYVPYDNLQVVAVGDAAAVRDVLKKYGPLEEYDTEGRKAQ